MLYNHLLLSNKRISKIHDISFIDVLFFYHRLQKQKAQQEMTEDLFQQKSSQPQPRGLNKDNIDNLKVRLT